MAEPGFEWNLSDSDIWSFSMRTPLSTCEKRLETRSFRQHKLRTLGFTGVKKTTSVISTFNSHDKRPLTWNKFQLDHNSFFFLSIFIEHKYSDRMQSQNSQLVLSIYTSENGNKGGIDVSLGKKFVTREKAPKSGMLGRDVNGDLITTIQTDSLQWKPGSWKAP